MTSNSFTRVVVIGQGYVGLPISINAAKSGYKVLGFDINEEKISQLQNGVTNSPEVRKPDLLRLQKKGKLTFINSMPKLSEKSIIVIAVPTPLDDNRNPDLSMLKQACEFISSILVDNSLVINESTSFIGTLRNYIKPAIEENSIAKNVKYAVAPERIDPGNSKWGIHNTPRLISGLDDEATGLAKVFYSKFCKIVHAVSKPEVAEAAKLFENTFRHVNIALVNELSNITQAFDISTHEIIQAAATKPFGFMPFYPGIGVGGHCIPVDPSYLLYSAESLGYGAKFIDLANETNLGMPNIVASRIQKYFGGNLQGKRIQIAGISYKPNISDLRESPALELMKVLTNLEAKVSWCDPYVVNYNGQSSTELNHDIDLGLIITPHDKINFSTWKNSGTKVLDLSANTQNYGWPKFL